MVTIRRFLLALLTVATCFTAGTALASAETVPLPSTSAATPDVQLSQSACASAGNCASVGAFVDTTGNQQGLIETETNGSWAASEVDLSSLSSVDTNPGVYLYSVSCPSAGNCVATGSYEDANGDQQGLIETETNGSWAASEVDLSSLSSVDTNPDVYLYSVSCPSAGNCVATGSYEDADGDQQGLIETETNGSWAASEVDLSSLSSVDTNPDVYLESVSCPSAGNCVATGSYEDANGDQQGLIETETNGSWVSSEVDVSDLGANGSPATTPESISCPSAGNCAVVGFYDTADAWAAFAENEQNGTWQPATELSLPTDATGSGELDLYAESVSCASAGNCTTVGAYDDYDGGANLVEPLIVTEANGTWAQGSSPALPTAASANPQAAFSSVVCTTATSCLAGGDYEDSSGNTDLLFAKLSGGSWTTTSTVASADDAGYNADYPGTPNESIACSAGGYCLESAFTDNTQDYTPFLYDAPGASATPSASVSGTQASVSWTAPADDGGLAITGYTVTANNVTDSSAAAITASVGASTTSATISGLTAGDSYTFTVSATSLLGVGLAATSATVAVPAAVTTTTSSTSPTRAQLLASLKPLLAPSGAKSRIKSLRKTHSFTFTYKPLESGTVTVKWYEVTGKGKKAKKHLVASGSAKTHGKTKAKVKVKLNKLGKRLIKTHTKLELTTIAAFTSGKTKVSRTHEFKLH